jgi:multicomponent Na+:H+ antiporter subunit D
VLDGRPSSPVVPELHGPSATAYLYALGPLVLAVGLAAADLAAARPLPRALTRAVATLRRIHNGRAGDYVAWTVAGSAVFGGLFAALLR